MHIMQPVISEAESQAVLIALAGITAGDVVRCTIARALRWAVVTEVSHDGRIYGYELRPAVCWKLFPQGKRAAFLVDNRNLYSWGSARRLHDIQL